MLDFTPPSRQKKSGKFTMEEIAQIFNKNVNTLRSAISRTEREIERAPDNRGRPAALGS